MQYFCENCEQLKAVNYFRKKLHHRCSTVLGSKYASGKHVLKLKNQNQHILSSSDNIQIVVHSHFYVHFSNNFPFWFRLKIFCLNLELRQNYNIHSQENQNVLWKCPRYTDSLPSLQQPTCLLLQWSKALSPVNQSVCKP